LKNNGGTANEVAFTEENGNHHIVNYFLPLIDGRNGSVKQDLVLVNDQSLNVEWLPFAFDPGGWTFCICLKEKGYGEIHLFRMDKIYKESFDFVCKSFDDFIDGLRTEDEAFA
jgi:SMI1-KNR4 cell-wall